RLLLRLELLGPVVAELFGFVQLLRRAARIERRHLIGDAVVPYVSRKQLAAAVIEFLRVVFDLRGMLFRPRAVGALESMHGAEGNRRGRAPVRSEEHTSELQSRG